jgi:hypothetical protein
MANPDRTSPGDDIIELTSFGVDIDFQATYGKVPRHVEVITAGGGALVLQTIGSGGVSRTITVYDQWQRVLDVTKVIASGTTITKAQFTF